MHHFGRIAWHMFHTHISYLLRFGNVFLPKKSKVIESTNSKSLNQLVLFTYSYAYIGRNRSITPLRTHRTHIGCSDVGHCVGLMHPSCEISSGNGCTHILALRGRHDGSSVVALRRILCRIVRRGGLFPIKKTQKNR